MGAETTVEGLRRDLERRRVLRSALRGGSNRAENRGGL